MMVPLRRRLWGLIAAALVPLVLFSCISVVLLSRQQRDETRKMTVLLARAVMSAVDAELKANIAVLQALSTASSLENGDLQGFRDVARRAVERRDFWHRLLVVDTSGNRVLDTASVDERVPADSGAPGNVVHLLRAAGPVIGNYTAEAGGTPVFTVRVPFPAQGPARYVLTAVVAPECVLRIILGQRVPRDTLVGIVDANDVMVARSRRHPEFSGLPVPDSLKRILAQGPEGWGESITQDGQKVYAGYSRSELTGWAAVVGVPEGQLHGPVRWSYAVLGAGVVLSLFFGLLAASLLSRRITRPIEALREAAAALGRGERLHSLPVFDIVEVNDVSEALAQAGAARFEAEARRERALQDEREAREAAERAVREKERAVAMLTRSNTELERFAYVASHDLQTPLRTVVSFTELLAQSLAGRLSEREADWMRRVTEGGLRMHRLIRELLAYARLDSRALPFVPVDLAAVFDTAVESLDAAIRQAGARVTRGPLPFVRGDPVQLSQLLQNLIDNAVKYRGSRPPTVHVHAEERDDEYVISVEDDGIGIAPEHHERIFGIFQRLHAENECEGTGIGLALCRRVVHRHGGRIWVESTPGKGATFRFTLPRYATD